MPNNEGGKTDESFLLWEPEKRVFQFKMHEEDQPVPLGEVEMEAAVNGAIGTMKEILVFLVEAAKKTPGQWASASSRPVTPGQGVI